MKTAVGGDDDRTGRALVAADQLECCLVGLRARVGEEHPAFGVQQGEEALGESDLALVDGQGGGVGAGGWGVAGARAGGWAWPRELSAMPAMRSVYSLPSASQTRQPSPRTSASGGTP